MDSGDLYRNYFGHFKTPKFFKSAKEETVVTTQPKEVELKPVTSKQVVVTPKETPEVPHKVIEVPQIQENYVPKPAVEKPVPSVPEKTEELPPTTGNTSEKPKYVDLEDVGWKKFGEALYAKAKATYSKPKVPAPNQVVTSKQAEVELKPVGQNGIEDELPKVSHEGPIIIKEDHVTKPELDKPVSVKPQVRARSAEPPTRTVDAENMTWGQIVQSYKRKISLQTSHKASTPS